MSKSKSFRVRIIADLTEREWQTLAIVTRLTNTRPRTYTFAENDDAPTDIYLVDGDQEEALRQWEYAQAHRPGPAVFLTTRPDARAGQRQLRRPMVPSALLGLVKLLDEVTIQEFSFVPELRIGQDDVATPGGLAISTKDARHSALVLDDSTTVLAQVGMLLNLSGVAADFADTAEMALDFIARNSYDIAFLDVVLPGKVDGYQVCKAIKKNKHTRHTAVVMLTSRSSAIDRVKASLAGCDAFLTKPVENETFQRTVHRFLGREAACRPGQPLPAC